jgi:hypothetical protein
MLPKPSPLQQHTTTNHAPRSTLHHTPFLLKHNKSPTPNSSTHLTERHTPCIILAEMDQTTGNKRSRGDDDQAGGKRQRTRKTTTSIFQIDFKKLTRLQNASEAHFRPWWRGPEPSFRKRMPSCQLLRPRCEHWASPMPHSKRTSRTPPRTLRRCPTEYAAETRVRAPKLPARMEPTSWT